MNRYLKDDCSDLATDLAKLSELPPSYTPDFLMRATREWKSSECVARDDHLPAARAHGTYRAIRETLGTEEQIERAIEQLRSQTQATKGREGDDERLAIVDSWIAVEAHLTDAEREELFARVVAHVFPGSRTDRPVNRAISTYAQGE